MQYLHDNVHSHVTKVPRKHLKDVDCNLVSFDDRFLAVTTEAGKYLRISLTSTGKVPISLSSSIRSSLSFGRKGLKTFLKS